MARDFGTVVKLVLLVGLVVLCAALGVLLVEKVRNGSGTLAGKAGVRMEPDQGASVAERPKTSQKETDQPVTMKGFDHVVYDEQGNPEAVIIGKEAQWWKRKTGDFYKIVAPLILSSAGDGEGLNLKTPRLRVEAKRADVLVRGGVLVQLYEEVRAEAEYFDITTTDVTYVASEHRLESGADIVLRKFRTGTDQGRSLEMEVKGKGFEADLTLKKVVILKEPVAMLRDVSGDFLAGGDKEPGEDGTSSDVIITCDGNLIYEHPARKVTFTDGVVVTHEERTLKCARLVVVLGREEGKESVGITDITASGDVELTYRDQVATGEQLRWQSVTQTGTLTGKGSVIKTDRFRIEGERLGFFRLNNRFQVDGAGRMTVKMGGGAPQRNEPAAAPAKKGLELRVPAFDANKPVDVSWRKEMTYDRSERWALFQEGVQVRQPGISVDTETLRITFGPEGEEVAEVIAEGSVKLTQQTEDGVRESVCEQVTWDAAKNVVHLCAGEGKAVEILSGGQRLVCSEVIFGPDKLECPAPGSIMLPYGGGADADAASAAIEVHWEQSMALERGESRIGLFRGDVQARRGRQKISSDILAVRFDPQMAPEKIIASGKAVLEVLPQDAPAQGDQPPEPADSGGQDRAGSGGPIGILRPGQGGSAWRLSSEEFVIEPARELVYADSGGAIELMNDGGVGDTIRWAKKMRIGSGDPEAYFAGNVEAAVSGSLLKSQELTVDFDAQGQPHHVNAEKEVEFSMTKEGSWRLKCGSAEAIFQAPGRLRQVIARDAVTLNDVKLELHCGTLRLSFDDVPADGKAALKHAVAQNDVLVNYEASEPVEARGDELSWDRTDGLYVLTGTPYAQLKVGSVISRHDRILINKETGVITQPKGTRPAEMEVTP